MLSLADRFWSKVDKAGECWLWTAASAGRYGQISYGGSLYQAHRVAWGLTYGSLSPGVELDHLCSNTLCVNPAHLEPVSHRENLRRGNGFPGQNARKTECKRGHVLAGENLMIAANGSRQCRTCRRERNRIYRQRRKERTNA